MVDQGGHQVKWETNFPDGNGEDGICIPQMENRQIYHS